MQEALKEAHAAAAEGEVPIGAVVVCKGRIIGKGHNLTETLHDPTAHAEMIAITAATEALGGKYLNEATFASPPHPGGRRHPRRRLQHLDAGLLPR